MALDSDKIKEFRRIGHHLKPTVIVGDAGLSDGVCQEISRALRDHELIKIKLNSVAREEKQALGRDLSNRLDCEVVQLIGNVALIYKKTGERTPKLSNIIRYYANDN